MIVVTKTEDELNLVGKTFKDKTEFLNVLDKKLIYHFVLDENLMVYSAQKYIDDGLIEYGII